MGSILKFDGEIFERHILIDQRRSQEKQTKKSLSMMNSTKKSISNQKSTSCAKLCVCL